MPEHESQAASPREVERLQRELRVREAERSTVRSGLAEIRADVERIGASRSWRWGHASARLAARLLRRPLHTHGAVAQALDRVDRLARVLAVSDDRPPRRDPASFFIGLTAANREVAPLGGDFHFATVIAGELERRGHPARVVVIPDEDEALGDADVVVVLRGRARHTPQATQLNVLWVISHPAELSGLECDGYDLVCVASERFAETLRAQTTTPVIVLEQATDPTVFHPDPAAGMKHEVVFVGNTRGVRRKVVHDLLPTSRDLAVFGGGWKGVIEPRYLVADHVPNDELGSVYSSASIVLSDHWEDMRTHGFISNRVYDAVACGAFVVSDRVEGIEERFDGAVVTYETREQLAELIDVFLPDQAERESRGTAGRARILASHTIAHRVDTLLQASASRAAELGFRPALRPPDAGRS